MSEDLLTVASDDPSASGTGEHFLTRNLIGDAESAPSRLAEALEQLGYYVLRQEPLQARRGARGMAAWIGSNNVLNYSVALTVAVKPLSAGASRVTFCYALKHRLLSGSGRQTLTREAEAIIALAALRSASSACVACGATAASGSRFCRHCGTPAVWAEPAELEVLKVTAGMCAGYSRAALGAGALALSFLVLLLAGLTTTLSFKVMFGVMVATALLGWALLLTGLRRLHRTLNPKNASQIAPPPKTISPTDTRSRAEGLNAERAPLGAEETTALLLTTPAGAPRPSAPRDTGRIA